MILTPSEYETLGRAIHTDTAALLKARATAWFGYCEWIKADQYEMHMDGALHDLEEVRIFESALLSWNHGKEACMI